jgi:hypothetical protein
LAIDGSVKPVVIVIVLPFPQLVVKQMDVLGNAVLGEKLVELLFIDAV